MTRHVSTTMFELRLIERLARATSASEFVSKPDAQDRLIAKVHEGLDTCKESDEIP